MRSSVIFCLAAALVAGSACVGRTASPRIGASINPLSVVPLETPDGQKPRVVITTDPELDDSNSLVRFLLYSSDFRVEGLIYASSQFHWKGDGKGATAIPDGRDYRRLGKPLCPCTSWRWAPRERFIDNAVDAYARAYPNLVRHDPSYPPPAQLRARVRWGNVAFDGEMSDDTPGSNLIRSLLLDREESPVYLHAWGGQSTIARALKSIEEQYAGTPAWPQIRAKVIRKAVIHPSGDQDDTYANYIKPHWPEIRYRQNKGGVELSYLAPVLVSQDDAVDFSAAWTRDNVSSRGALGAFYRVWGDGRQMVPGDPFDYFWIAGKTAEQLKAEGYDVWAPVQPKGAFIAEGDTPTFLNLVNNGLRGFREDSYGGWGGYRDPDPPSGGMRGPANPPASGNASGYVMPPRRSAAHPFLAAAQRDFAARLLWATTPDDHRVNHYPRITLESPRSMHAKSGERVTLKAKASDPDRQVVKLRWWEWGDADTYAGTIQIERLADGIASFVVPDDARSGDTIHFILEATDSGTPALTRYERVVVRVE